MAHLARLRVLLLVMAHGASLIPKMAATSNGCPTVCRCKTDDNLDCSGAKLIRPPVTPITTLTLDLSRNSLGPIINATFAKMSNLTDLDLSCNGLRRLLGCTFNGMLSLRRVSLRGNKLSTLPDSLFTDANGMEHLDLSHNLFIELPDHAFRNTPNLKTLDLSHNRAVELKLGRRFQVPRFLKFLDLSYNRFETIEADAFKMADQWEIGIKRILRLANCRLTDIQPGALTKIPHLNDLDLSGNPEIPVQNLTAVIKEFESRRLEKLSLSGMNLTNIQSFFTQVTLVALKFLNVSHNQISSVPSRMFSTIRSLRVLDLSHNKLTSLGAGIKDLVNLRALNLSSNAMTSFTGVAVNSLKLLENLDVSNNRLENVQSVNFRPMIKLKYLKVKTNLLPSVILPQTTNNLIDLDYSSNSIRQFRGFDNVPKLERFDISDNDLEKVTEFQFKQAHYVKIANYSRNSITELDPRAFLPTSPLVLDLSHNDMTMTQFSNWIATQELYLNHNQINEVYIQTFLRMTGLRVLDMSENNITTLHEDLFVHTTAIEYLNLSHNSLTENYFSVLLRHLRELKSLDLGSNQISSLNETMFAPLPNLQRLSVRNNHLKIIMPRVFRDLKYIREIDLSNNPFSCVCDLLALRDWLSRTQIAITGLYNHNSSAYICQGPKSRLGKHVIKWEPEQFECDEVMLYMIVFGSIGLTLIIAGVISTILHRLYQRHQRKKKEKEKIRLETTGNLKKSGKKGDLKRMTSEEIAEEITDAIERRERKNMRKAEISKKGNGYVLWQAVKKEGEKVKQKEDNRSKNTVNEASAIKDKSRVRSPERYYDHLIRTDDGRMELIARGRDQRDRGKDGHKNEGRRDGKKDREGEYIDIDGEIVRLRHEKSGHNHPYWRHPDRGHYSDQDYTYRTEPARRRDPYITAPPPGLPPRNRWDAVEIWDRDARGWVVPGHRRSRSQDNRRNREDQRYMTMPIRDLDYQRARSYHRGGYGKPNMYLDHYTNEVRFGIEDLHRYPGEQRRSRKDLYESRSKSYHQLPSEYRGADDGRVSPRRAREPRDIGYDERQGWADNRRPPIGRRIASQPYLTNEHVSDWL